MSKAKVPSQKSWPRLRRIFSYLLAYKAIFFAGLAVAALFGLTEAAVPWLMYLLFEPEKLSGWIEPANVPYVLPALLLGVFLARGLLGFARIYWREWMLLSVARDIRREMFKKMVRLPKSYHDREASGMVIARAMQFVDDMFTFCTEVLITLFQDVARLAGFLGTMLVINWRYTLVAVVVLPFTTLMIAIITKRIRRFAGLRADALGNLTSSLSDTLQGLSVVKSFGGMERELTKLDNSMARTRAMGLRQGVAMALNVPLSQLLLACALSIIFALLAFDMVNETMSVGEISSFIFAMALLPLPLRNLANMAGNVQQSLAAADKVFYLLDAEPEADAGSHDPPKVAGAIEFSKVRFRYPSARGRWALDDFELSVKPGETLALVGRTGSGKTTVTSLLMRLYHAEKGTVALDGVDVNEWKLATLRNAIALVSQDVILFNTTVAENVAYPHTGDSIDTKRLDQALADADAAELVAAMPAGIDTELGERGLRLSGGERQRLSLARAFYCNAPILVMDEATSSLDSQTEKTIRNALQQLLAERTAIVIAHRFATVEIADRIAVLDEGRVIASGSHAQLLASAPLYANLYKAQQLTDEANKIAPPNG